MRSAGVSDWSARAPKGAAGDWSVERWRAAAARAAREAAATVISSHGLDDLVGGAVGFWGDAGGGGVAWVRGMLGVAVGMAGAVTEAVQTGQVMGVPSWEVGISMRVPHLRQGKRHGGW